MPVSAIGVSVIVSEVFCAGQPGWGTRGNTAARVDIISIDQIRIKTNYVNKIRSRVFKVVELITAFCINISTPSIIDTVDLSRELSFARD